MTYPNNMIRASSKNSPSYIQWCQNGTFIRVANIVTKKIIHKIDRYNMLTEKTVTNSIDFKSNIYR